MHWPDNSRSTPLAKEKGVWVLRTHHPLAASVTDDLLTEIREQRDKQKLASPGRKRWLAGKPSWR